MLFVGFYLVNTCKRISETIFNMCVTLEFGCIHLRRCTTPKLRENVLYFVG